MKAISLWEPWATAMALGLKHYETRSWPTTHRGRLAICSAKRPLDEVGIALCEEFMINTAALQFGVVLCVVNVTGCQPSEHFGDGRAFPLLGAEESWGNYSHGRYVWTSNDLMAIHSPVKVTGRQGLFELPADVFCEVLRQLPVLAGYFETK
jgi:hypothetical protein